MRIDIPSKCKRFCGVDYIDLEDTTSNGRKAIISDKLREVYITNAKLSDVVNTSAMDCRRMRNKTRLFKLLVADDLKIIDVDDDNKLVEYVNKDYIFITRTGNAKHKIMSLIAKRFNEKDYGKEYNTGIYVLYNKTTTEAYVGMTTRSFCVRLQQHYSSKQLGDKFLLHPDTKMYVIESIDTDYDNMLNIEVEYIKDAIKSNNIKLLNTYDYFDLR